MLRPELLSIRDRVRIDQREMVMKHVKNKWYLLFLCSFIAQSSLASECSTAVSSDCEKGACFRLPTLRVGSHSCSNSAVIATKRSSVSSFCKGQTSVTYTGLLSLSTETCSSSGYYANLENQTRLGLGAGELTIFRALKAENKLTVGYTSTACPSNGSSFNFLLLRGHAPDDFSDPVDYSGDSGYIGGVLGYSPSNLTGNQKFNLKSPSANDTTAFNFGGFNGDLCTSTSDKKNAGQMLVEASGVNPFTDKYMTVSFGAQTGSFTTASPNPFVGILAPVASLPSTFWSSRGHGTYTGLYTWQEKALIQEQEVLYVGPSYAANVPIAGEFRLYKANSCDPNSTGCSPKGRYLNNPQERTVFGTLTCNQLNSPSNGFCRGELSLDGITPKGNAVCLPIAQLPDHSGSKDMVFCAAQHPNDKSALVSLVFSATSESVVGVQVLDENGVIQGEQHLDSTTANRQIKVKISNLSARTVSSYQLSSLDSPFSQSSSLDPNVSITSFGSLSEAQGCGTSLPPFSSCIQTVGYSPSNSGIHLGTYIVTYDNGIESTGASAYLKGTKSLQAILPLGSNSGSTIFKSLYSPVSLSAQACLGSGLGNCSSVSIPMSYLNWSATGGAGSLNSADHFEFSNTEGAAQLTSDLWSGEKTGSITLVPFNPSTVSLLAPPSATEKLHHDFHSVVHETTEGMPLSPILPILSP